MTRLFFSFFVLIGQLLAKDCREIIARLEKVYNIPQGLLMAIAKVESNCRPYAVSSGRQARYFDSLSAAVRFAEQARGQGRRNVSVGCMQLHFSSHRRSFENAYQMLHPEFNIGYAARMVASLYRRYGSWERAVRAYNCGSPHRARHYWSKVARFWGR